MIRAHYRYRCVMSISADDRLANLLGAVATGVDGAVVAALTSDGLDATTATALVALLDFSPAGSVERLRQGVGLTHSGAVRLVNRLDAMGLAERRAGDDQRSVAVVLTRAGRRAARRLRRRRSTAVRDSFVGLTLREREQLTAACEVMLATLTRERLAQRMAGEAPAGGALCRLCDFATCGRPDGRCPVNRAAAGD
jgi:DNA-binding MarR family transcriptional regulator